jgi:hypothetical protein
MMTVSMTPFGAMTITLSGDLSGAAVATLVPGLITDLRGKRAARKARKGRRPMPPMPYIITVDITGVTCLGLNGAGLLRGIFQSVNCQVVCRAGDQELPTWDHKPGTRPPGWTPSQGRPAPMANTINLLSRGAIATI